ncbi:MAG: Competence protein CoiA-like family protein [Promethearchaeota archaeon]|nr:MAG: Competence protein CoiA-like family protein [Candidatus Lokiarchaeota archaeon]
MTNALNIGIGTPSESFSHKAIKQLIIKYISKYDPRVVESSLEKYFRNRRADVYFKLRSGEEIVVEIQNSRIGVKEIAKRTKDYNKKGIFVLWLLNGKGKIVNTPKKPSHIKNVKISPAEHYLHTMYGGRVYYVNINRHLGKFTITPPYALHFSPSDTKATRIFKTQFDYYYIRNANHVKVPNWKLLCVDYKYKIARFYDKHARKILKTKISESLRDNLAKNCDNCNRRFKWLRKCVPSRNCNFQPFTAKKLLKTIKYRFGTDYGKNMILGALEDLSKDGQRYFSEKLIHKKLKHFKN